MDNIGNLTLIEGKNSENGHKGNCSLGSKSYHKKKDSYKKSSCKITNKIYDHFNDFDEYHIKERNTIIVELLNKYKIISPTNRGRFTKFTKDVFTRCIIGRL